MTTQRIFSLILSFCLFNSLLFAQTPETIKMDSRSSIQVDRRACADQFAGTVTVDNAAFTGQSNDIDLDEIFLCFGDVLEFTHNGDQNLTGDPNMATPAGIGYIFYKDRPTVSGPDLTSIEADPSLLLTPAPTAGNLWTYTDQINGDATFQNTNLIDTDNDGIGDISLQDFFNNGQPVRIWFAPFTFDRLDNSLATFEGTPAGPCVNVNIAAAFSVVYLNPITGINQTVVDATHGTFTLDGGLPEFDGSNYSSISISLSSNSSIMGTVTNAGPFTHGSTVEFSAPQVGVYDITVTDTKGCGHTFQMELLEQLTSQIGCDFVNPSSGSSEICLDVSVSNFTDLVSMQYAINWDPSILQFSRLTGFNLTDLDNSNFGFPPSTAPGVLTLSWNDFSGLGVSRPDGTSIYQVCFNVLGGVAQGTSTPVIFANAPPNQPIEIVKADGTRIGLDSLAGKVYVGDPPANTIRLDPTIATNPEVLICDPTNGGSTVNFTIIDGTDSYDYQWVNTTTNETGTGTAANGVQESITGLSPGSYSITVSDQACGLLPFNFTIAQNNLGVQINTAPPLCNGQNTGSVTAQVFDNGVVVNNVTGYTFSWQGFSVNAQTINNIPSGSYKVTVTDPNGCTAEASSVLSQPSRIDVLDGAMITPESCTTGGDGSIVLSPSGGTPGAGYSYQWNIAGTTNTQTGLIAGVYMVTVTDDNSCTATENITITVPSPPTIASFDSTSVACVNDNNGSLTVNVNTASAGITIDSYAWTGPGSFSATGQTINNLGPGDYSVTATASDGCFVVGTASLFAPSALALVDTVKVNPTCPGDDDGSLAVQINGGTSPYFYRWSTGDSGNNFSSLPRITAGSYTVTVVDANQCDSIVITATLEDPDSIRAQFTNIQQVSCFEGIPCDGQARVLASGGSSTTGIYTFTWSSGESEVAMSSSASQLCQGMQFVVIADGICGDTFPVMIPSPEKLDIDITATNISDVSCNGGNDGSITVVPVGGTPGYTYEWQDGSTNATLSGLSQGTYVIVITDANGCTLPSSFPIGEPDVMVASIDSSNTMDVSCFGETDGVVAVKWTGGNGPGGETYQWSPDVTTNSTATNLGAGAYLITVTDRKGCSSTTQYEVKQPTPVIALVPTPDEPICHGYQTQVGIFSASGGAGGPYTFSVNNGPQQDISATIPVFASEDIPVSVFDADGCPWDTTITINEPPEILVDLGPDVEVQLGDSITLNPFIGSVQPIDSIVWTPTDQYFRCPNPLDVNCLRPVISPLNISTYVLDVYDVNGCKGSDQIIIDVDKNRNIYLPNVFSPDGNGINDEFHPFVGAGVKQINSLQIFDRWGELVFATKEFDPDDRTSWWDGRYRNKKVNPGVYVYLMEVTFLDGVTLVYRGDVAVLK